MQKRLRFIALLIALAAASYAWIQWGDLLSVKDKNAPAAISQQMPPQGAGGPPMAMPVEAVKVRVSDLAQDITAVGTLASNESVLLRPEIPGRVERFNFDEGQRVAKGTLLIKLDDATLRAELEQAKANLALSQANNERATRLYTQGAGTARAKDEAEAKLKVDQAQVELAKARLDKTVIHAPFDGLVGLRKISVGAYVAPGDDIVNLENIDPIKVDFRVPEIYLPVVKQGQKLQITADAFPGKVFDGQIFAINPAIDEQGRSIIIRARLPNPDLLLRPGLFVRLALTISDVPNALLVPEQAVIPGGGGFSVFKIVDGKAQIQIVTIGKRRKGMVEIVSGLASEDMVVTAGQMKLRPGAPVQVITPAAGG